MSDFLNQGAPEGAKPTETPTAEQGGVAGTAASAQSAPAQSETVGRIDVSPAAASEPAGDFPQHYTLLFCSVALFIACVCLPIEGRVLDLYAKDSISGGFLTVFAGYAILAKWINIHNRKMIVWPVFFAAADGIYVAVTRGIGLVKPAMANASDMAFRDWVRLFGPGYYVIAICSLLVMWTLLTAVMDGAKKDAARKEAAKAARGKK